VETTAQMSRTQTPGVQIWSTGPELSARCSAFVRYGRRTLTPVLTQRTLVDGANARCVVDYSLARRATLDGLRAGRIRPEDACDAQVYLRRAARYHGQPSTQTCPVCQAEPLVLVSYAFGECFPNGGNGRARARKELRELEQVLPEFSVFVVEVCLGCGWNYLLTSYVLGTGEAVPRRRRSGSSSGSRG